MIDFHKKTLNTSSSQFLKSEFDSKYSVDLIEVKSKSILEKD